MNKSAWNGLSWIVGQALAIYVAVSLVGAYSFTVGMAAWAVLTVLVDIRKHLGDLQ